MFDEILAGLNPTVHDCLSRIILFDTTGSRTSRVLRRIAGSEGRRRFCEAERRRDMDSGGVYTNCTPLFPGNPHRHVCVCVLV